MLKTLSSANKKGLINESNMTHDENQYLCLIKDILEHGNMEKGRNGNALTVFGSAMHFSLENNKIPLMTTKRLAWKTCLRELLWFINGSTSNKVLKEKNVHIWDGNASREFLDSRGLYNLEEDDLGPVYGHQWRFFNASYTNCNDDYTGKGVDQLDYIIKCLKDPEQRNSRRLVMSAWNPCQIDEMALPPCHVLCQFNVINGNQLSCSLYQRSGDVGLGVPFNIASYSFLTHLIAKHCDLSATDFYYYLGNCHIYDDHIESLKTQLNREPFEFPTLIVNQKLENINDYSEDMFIIENYKFHDNIKMEMRK
jgi:thymidylate synthase